MAASKGNVTSLKHLIEQGIIDINERDEKGSTPAHKAAGNNQAEVLQYLIHTGADSWFKFFNSCKINFTLHEID